MDAEAASPEPNNPTRNERVAGDGQGTTPDTGEGASPSADDTWLVSMMREHAAAVDVLLAELKRDAARLDAELAEMLKECGWGQKTG